MKQFNKLSMVLFDSTNASFKLSVEGVFTKQNQMGGVSPLVYITQNGNGNLNPNIYLMFSYKSDTFDKGNMLYTSYPQLFRIREAMESIKNLVANLDGFIKDENGMYLVRQEYTQPVVLANIGKQNKWLSLNLAVLKTTEEGVTTTVPGVSLEISSANGNKSMLTVDEFLTIYTIIKDIDLASIQANMSLAFLMGTSDAMPQQQYPQQGYQQPNNGGYYQQGMRQQYQQPRQYTTQQPVQQHYGNNSYQRPAPQGRAPYTAPAQQPAPAMPQQQNNQHLQPRESQGTPIMTLGAVDATSAPVEDMIYNDSDAIDEIFK